MQNYVGNAAMTFVFILIIFSFFDLMTVLGKGSLLFDIASLLYHFAESLWKSCLSALDFARTLGNSMLFGFILRQEYQESPRGHYENFEDEEFFYEEEEEEEAEAEDDPEMDLEEEEEFELKEAWTLLKQTICLLYSHWIFYCISKVWDILLLHCDLHIWTYTVLFGWTYSISKDRVLSRPCKSRIIVGKFATQNQRILGFVVR